MPQKIYNFTFRIMLLIGILFISFASDVLYSDRFLKSSANKVLDLPDTHPLTLNDSENYRFNEIALVVKDIKAAVEDYTRLFGLQFGPIKEYKINAIEKGKTNSYTQATAFAKLGHIEIELIQIIEGESIHTDFLKAQGEGIHHLGFRVAELEKEMNRADALELKLISSFEVGEIMVFAYYEKSNGLMIELVQENVREMIEAASKKAEQMMK